MPWGYAAATIGGAYLASQGAKNAANTQSQADIAAQNTQKQMFNKIVGQEQPFLQAGKGATVGLSALYGTNGKNNQAYGDFGGTGNFSFNPNSILNNPGFKFQMRQGDRALQSNDATTVGALSGAAMKDLSSFNQGLASTYENQYFNQALSTQQQNYNQALQGYQTNQGNYYTNQNNIFNRLSQIASLGQNAAGNLGSQGATLGTGVAQAQAAQGAAQAAGQVGAANAYAGAASTIPLYALLSGQNNNTGGDVNAADAAAAANSDRRLKEDIKRIGKTDAGLPLYSYRYKGEPRFYIGPMADEVRQMQPEAVFTGPDGYDKVFYGELR